ncbi:hypothetical protein CYPRO_3142 [Cyclonatronum proteinivorum]|uniref:Uncharacterized protein n=1 Tax=Cyclonatronum proteinivorum TaxID=1457365 RepID=A0A345UPH4_9BACT|nr:hypothetical protein [Cyclonatronum proteinivorum]AXJ02376.1 hypothetical protein CYPRO_3142 [Cyclonatronum proteinivorum]
MYASAARRAVTPGEARNSEDPRKFATTSQTRNYQKRETGNPKPRYPERSNFQAGAPDG